jgi:hypothetical protein
MSIIFNRKELVGKDSGKKFSAYTKNEDVYNIIKNDVINDKYDVEFAEIPNFSGSKWIHPTTVSIISKKTGRILLSFSINSLPNGCGAALFYNYSFDYLWNKEGIIELVHRILGMFGVDNVNKYFAHDTTNEDLEKLGFVPVDITNNERHNNQNRKAILYKLQIEFT